MEQHGKILVLGVGNPLAGDDGVGPEIVRRINSAYRFPDRVTVIDIGPNILSALETIAEADHLLIIDAVLDDEPPGTVITRNIEENVFALSSGQHQLGIEELLARIDKFCGCRPQTAIVGIVPKEISRWSDQLSDEVLQSIPQAIRSVLDRLHHWGIQPAT